MTVPFDGISLAEHPDVFRRLADLGYTDVWSAESDGTDAFTPLAVAAQSAPSLRLGTAIVPAFTRGPGLLAMQVAALAELAPGRVALGLGTSSNVIVEGWNAIPFVDPYRRTRDMLRFLRTALTGERVDAEYDTFSVRGFRLGRPPDKAPSLMLAALRPQMLRLAGLESDGVILNWLSPDDVPTVLAEVGPGPEVIARVFVCVDDDADRVRAAAKRMITTYLNVPVYAAFHEWLGRGDVLEPMWKAWRVGDRREALEAVPDSLVDELVIHGSAAQCREGIQRYVDQGVTTPVIALQPPGGALADVLVGLAPTG